MYGIGLIRTFRRSIYLPKIQERSTECNNPYSRSNRDTKGSCFVIFRIDMIYHNHMNSTGLNCSVSK